MRHRRIPLFCLVALAVCPSGGARAQTQADLDRRAERDFQGADARLNAVYTQVRAGLDATARRKLEKSERAWLAYRDAEADLEADVNRGGSMAPMVYSSARADLTDARIRVLQQYQADMKGH